MADSNKGIERSSLLLNAAIGFLGFLLVILVFSLITRLLYPRIISDRSEQDPALISSVIQLEVLNGCGIPGLATAYTGTLRNYGFDVVETGNFDHFNVENTIVIARTAQLENARRVASALGIDEKQILREISGEFYLDVTLVLGADYESLNL
ncbi:LytR family transcriptional regulator [Rhodohalobacter sp. SW132]|uniref:LytR C-terminal domain-containing protein n=1 Tax=Rhodohalobacter sp. SW132 TaxID=2293433 RepID=UPI000E283518|nr:LytR C-terminal domain-containing protein [Rhodohalobacter sp. SW132]REL29062.1 LytR family transcriptional regulator [Rhodohalobacter sp. SW132]